MTELVSYSTGTAAVSAGGTTVTGTGTIWSGVNARPGDIFQIGNYQSVISDVVDTGTLAIPPWGGGAQAGAAYKIWQVSPQRFAGAQAMADVSTLVAALNKEGFFFFVDTTETVPDPSLGDDGQYAFQPSTGKTWVKTAGAWSYLGIYKSLRFTGAYNGATVYSVGDVMTDAGSSYVWINPTPGSGHAAPNPTYWQVLASKGTTGSTGAVPWGVPVDWATATAYVADPPASIVRHPTTKNLYQCLVPHTSGAFATDLAAGKWLLIAQSLTEGTSVTSLLIGTGTKVFATQVGLSYQNGVRLRASSAANSANWMEGVCSYDGVAQTVTMTVDKTGGSGTFADWLFNHSGQPGAGDLSSANALSELTGVAATARANIGIHQGEALPASCDFNTVTTPGSYYTADVNSTNVPPVTGAHWYLEVEYHGIIGPNAKQIATQRGGANNIFTRVLASGTWGPWVKIASYQQPLSAAQDFNTVTTPGSYYTLDNTSPNAPTAGWWYLEVEQYATDPTNYAKQRATRLEGGVPCDVYVRNKTAGTWGAWRKTAIADTPIANGTNFDTITASGTYYTLDNTCTNTPSALNGGDNYFMLEVVQGITANYVHQRAIGENTGKVFVRQNQAGTWGAWSVLGGVTGPASATDNAAARFDATTGKLIQDSALLIADTTGALSRVGGGGIPIQGMSSNAAAVAAGNIGEYMYTEVPFAGAPTMPAVDGNLIFTFLDLTAGVWLVGGQAGIWLDAGGQCTHMHAGHGLGETTISTSPGSGSTVALHLTSNNTNGWIFPMGIRSYNLPSGGRINAVATATFSVAACHVYGSLWAVRIA